jgi:enoyl-CoA hydratase/carnithine racemase
VIRAQKTSHPHPLWIAGGDLIELAAIADKEQAAAYAKSMIEICLGLESLPIPVICAIDGQAIGGGVELALAADLRIASASAQFEFKQLKVGLATGYGGASRLSSLLGLSRAKGLLMLTEKLKAHDALAIGLIHKLVSDKRINDGIQALVDDLLALNANALAVQKKMLHFSRDMSFQNCQEQEFSFFQKLWRNPSHSAFLDQFSKRRS